MSLIRLQAAGHFVADEGVKELSDSIERPVMLIYVGEFQSMDGPVTVTEEMVTRLVANHNARLLKAKLPSGEVDLKCCPPVQLDHSVAATHTVGRVVGELVAQETEVEGVMRKAVFSKVRILGRENVEKIVDGRWTHVSVGCDFDQGQLNELSITPFPAAASASLLSKKNLSTGGTMDKEKMKKHLMEVQKMSAEDADKKLAEMPEDEKTKLAAEVDENEKKMAADAEKAEKDRLAAEEKDKEAKLALKTNFTRLAGGLKKGMIAVQTEAKTASLGARLSRLQSESKITPAERKKMNIAELAAKPESELSAMLSTYESREPVLDTRVYSTQKAEKIKDVTEKYRLAKMELEVRMAMPSKRTEAQKALSRLAEEEKTEKTKLEGDTDGTPHTEYMAHYDGISKMLDDGVDKERVKAAMKKMMEDALTKMGGDTKEGDKQLSGLAENFKRLQTEFKELIELVGPALGVDAKELE